MLAKTVLYTDARRNISSLHGLRRQTLYIIVLDVSKRLKRLLPQCVVLPFECMKE